MNRGDSIAAVPPPAMTSAPSNIPAPPGLDTALAVLGRLLEYPGPDFDGFLAHARDTVDSLALVAFCDTIAPLDHDQREELYTATFDVTPRCVPYASIHLFGEENFKRGEFMAALHQQYELAGFTTGGELPDHVAVLLGYAATLGESARRELVEFCLLGPLGKIAAALAEDHPYRFLLDAVDETLRAAYPGIQAALSPVEQMRQHGVCPTVSDGCHCGPIVDGPLDDGAPASAGVTTQDRPAEAGAPILPTHSTL